MEQNMTPEQEQQVLQQVRMKASQMALTELLGNINDRCFKKCVQYPSTKLSTSEQTCIAYCMDRYQDTLQVVAQSLQDES
eukprot:snap_masked-scaffold_5-processed-gene-3.20-mRNA-1 protein AED:0.03 eAED:0.03 QI:0/-1/0/1/-1/1/1/0/79